jgi:hypothetical protein
MKYTSAEANKLIKKIEDRIRLAQQAENKSSVFFAASGEDAESLRPKYDFAASQAKLEELEAQLRAVKHAVNCFNVSHTLPGFKGVTVDKALVLIPQLRARIATLREMVNRLPKERVDNTFRNTSIIDYSITNYDIEEVQKKYDELGEKLSALQLALDTLNNTETMDIDVVLE